MIFLKKVNGVVIMKD